MKNKKVYIFFIIIIIFLILLMIGVKFGEKISNNMGRLSQKKKKIEERLYESPDNFIEEYAEVKGRVISSIKGKDYFYITNMVYLNEIGIDIEGYSEYIVNITSDSKIIDYNTLTNISLNDIQQDDVIFYNGIVKKATDSASTIEVENNEIYVLKSNDIKKLAIEKYGGKSELDNVCISYIDNSHILVQIQLNTNKNDSIIYLTYMKLSDNIKVDEYCRNKYADIVMNKPFNNFTEGENEVVEIDFK